MTTNTTPDRIDKDGGTMNSRPLLRLEALYEANALTEVALGRLRAGDRTGAQVAIEHAKRLRTLDFSAVA